MPAIRTTVVGSYPVPSWLGAEPSAEALRDALLVVLKTQELCGIDVLSDGELARFDAGHPETNGMIDAFVKPLAGVQDDASDAELAAFGSDATMDFRREPAGVVRDAVLEGTLDLPSEWQGLRGLTDRPLKFTVTSPYMLAHTLLDRHYADVRELTRAIADVLAAQIARIDAPIVQVDEARLTGHAGDASWAHGPINRVLGAARGEKGMHLCFGNYGGRTIQKGDWASLIAFFNELDVDHLVLELARRGYDELPLLRELRPDIALGIGVIDIKDHAVEDPAVVARRIEQAVAVLGAERVRWVHPDCGFWMLSREVADAKMRALVAGRDVFLGR